VSDFLEANLSKFKGWECDCCKNTNSSVYDSLVNDFQGILRKYSLIGYHCTKLTKEEIDDIRSNGMALQNADTLTARINKLLYNNSVNNEVAQCLRHPNQSDAYNRANKLWFCFFEPFLAGESGIGRFFRLWGGEALYNWHEDNPVTETALRNIGIPCLIKANVPIASLSDYKFPDGSMARILLLHSGHRIKHSVPVIHDGFSTQNISAQNIIEIIEHPSASFMKLTKCKEWKKYAI
jgi:hypothetical protein